MEILVFGANDRIFLLNSKPGLKMSGNMFIFGFGFVLGGFTVMLVMGLFFLIKDKIKLPNFQDSVTERVSNPVNYPRFVILRGGKDRSPFTGPK